MLRLSLLWLLVGFLSVYAFRDWFKALCGLILLMAVVEHPDFPKSVMGIQGLNPWNIVLAMVIVGWTIARKREGLVWDMPAKVNFLLVVYFTLILVSFLRLVSDLSSFEQYSNFVQADPPSILGLASEKIINCLKWVIPGLLLFDGCRSDNRFRLATYAIVAVYAALAIQVIRWMPLSNLTSGADLAARSLKILVNEVGYHRVNMSMILAGGSWAFFCARPIAQSPRVRMLGTLCFIMVLFGMALTGGRMGYVTWAAIGGLLGMLKWRKILILGPLAVMIVVATVPAVRERFAEGMSGDTVDTNARIEAHAYGDTRSASMYTITAGRTFAWPFVFREIGESPIFGQGREAMITSGLALRLLVNYGESFPHPHNAYLQWIMDNGILGFIPVFAFYLYIVVVGVRLFKHDDWRALAIGGVLLSLVMALLIASFGSQSFYPREGSVGMWCAIGLALRVYQQIKINERRSRRKSKTDNKVDFWEPERHPRKGHHARFA